ncbi:Uncharacterised protein [Legionella busanensis]|uniref:Coiled-coil protein n=1 Tax=Legionella busanensis TaxID=190655 RepID=A0A378JLD3_9GAMM|nr:hypothetical protein [Legionella busanensis]STX51113.1 Uncharacterised protein [Legionella busanensis]
MPGPRSAKGLLHQYNEDELKKFIKRKYDKDSQLKLPRISLVPGYIGGTQVDTYTKTSPDCTNGHISFLKKNGHAENFTWTTTPQNLKRAVRWGIIKPESLTGKVIACLGQYRILAHERVAKGMVSNTQHIKLELLDVYQDRIEALQDLERLVNNDNSEMDFVKAVDAYIQKIHNIQANLNLQSLAEVNPGTRAKILADLNEEVSKARAYLTDLSGKNLRPYNRARGRHSILEFVKQQTMRHLYELQGVNQDLTYSNQRFFALTRGELNDYIEDARKIIDDYEGDPRNIITAAHQGNFTPEKSSKVKEGEGPATLVTYDFTAEHLNGKQERQVLLAISFIEGWDEVDYTNPKKPKVKRKGKDEKEELSFIAATRWKTHRNFKAFIISFAYFIGNIFKSMIWPIKPWQEETWKDKEFHLAATELFKHAKLDEPMWYKFSRSVKKVGDALLDLFKGVFNVGGKLFHQVSFGIRDDWYLTESVEPLEDTFKEVQKEIDNIDAEEKKLLEKTLSKLESKLNENGKFIKGLNSKVEEGYPLAKVPYHLTAGEQNDILTSMVRGVNGFANVFTHNIFAKDPVAGLAFLSTYAIGGAVIFFPAVCKAFLPSAYINWFTHASYCMGSSHEAAAIAGGSTQAQIGSSVIDLIAHGPTSSTMQVVSDIVENPITVAAGCVLAYSLGYYLVNGIKGHTIPYVSDFFQSDLGSVPQTGYPLIGAKVGISIYEGFHTPANNPYIIVALTYKHGEVDEKTEKYRIDLTQEDLRIREQMRIATWLVENAEHLPKLKPKSLITIARQIDTHFSEEEAAALKKLLYPEKKHSIAYQLFAIPTSYIPTLLRVLINSVMSFVALVAGKPNPGGPIKQALKDLRTKITTDLTRLINTNAELVKLVYTGIASIFKVLTFVGVMAISRVAGWAGMSPGHNVHRGIAKVHNFFRSVGEFFYPARAIKNVVVAHPTSVITKVEESYSKLLHKLGKQAKLIPQEEVKQWGGPDKMSLGASNLEVPPEKQNEEIFQSSEDGKIVKNLLT